MTRALPPEIREGAGSVRINTIGDVEVWLTAVNRLFVVQGNRVAFPSLLGTHALKFDDPKFKVSLPAEEALRSALLKQREIRRDWPTPEEDEIAFQWN